MTPRHGRKKARPKTISTQGITGQRGVNVIEGVVLQMGSRWTPSGPNEVGIDGYIELFDPSSHEPLGLTLAVQSKVISDIADDSKTTFDYWCDTNDIEYWLGGNMPIILVVSAGSSDTAYWISVKQHFKDWQRPSPAHIRFDKSKHQFNRDSFDHLVAIAAPRSGLYLAPLRRDEILHTNLLQLESCPPSVHVAGTDCRHPREVWTSLRSIGGEVDAGWILWEKKIFSFHDLSKMPWSSICDLGTLEEFSTTDLSESDDPQWQRTFVQLLNQTLKSQLYPGIRFWPQEECYAMAGPPRALSYESARRRSKITVVSKFSSPNTDGRKFEWLRHLAFRGQFRLFSGRWYLEITPTYRFTSDGFTLDRFHEDRLKGIKRIEGNRAVLSSILFWADYLRPRAGLFRGVPPPLQFGELLSFPCDVGIVDQAWQSQDTELTEDADRFAKQFLLTDVTDGAAL